MSCTTPANFSIFSIYNAPYFSWKFLAYLFAIIFENTIIMIVIKLDLHQICQHNRLTCYAGIMLAFCNNILSYIIIFSKLFFKMAHHVTIEAIANNLNESDSDIAETDNRELDSSTSENDNDSGISDIRSGKEQLYFLNKLNVQEFFQWYFSFIIKRSSTFSTKCTPLSKLWIRPCGSVSWINGFKVVCGSHSTSSFSTRKIHSLNLLSRKTCGHWSFLLTWDKWSHFAKCYLHLHHQKCSIVIKDW